ncbi:MAG: mechanosensitive ion channel family protein [Gammaproteobacteria bacterium]|nr:mechanosensitive ion channel family protein [Gammaproteobacteria bacterium]
MTEVFDKLALFGVSTGVLLSIIGVVWFVNQRLLGMYGAKPGEQHTRQILMALSWLAAIILAVLLMPVGDAMRGQLLGFLGILLSATIALSSTTLVGNAMAGLMLKSLRNFRIGDYIRVGEYFGRISNMDLLHVEVQTEDRDLTTLPNLFLVSHPVTVIRSSGTILHVVVSLGYDVPRKKAEAALLAAANKTDLLERPYVQIRDLGDFSISYQVSGLLTDIDKLISTRRKLRANTVDALHDAGIEIVSPTYMMTRSLTPGHAVLPLQTPVGEVEEDPDEGSDPDEIVFDKARQAEELELHKAQYTEMSQRLLELEQALKEVDPADEAARRPVLLEKKKLEAAINRLAKRIAAEDAALNG